MKVQNIKDKLTRKNIFIVCLLLFLIFVFSKFVINFDSNTSINYSELSKNKTINKNLTYDLAQYEFNTYKGDFVEWGGRVFIEPDYDSKGVYLQIFYKDISEKPFIVFLNNPSFKIKDGDYVIIKGWVIDIYEGKNLLGGIINGINILADSIDITKRSNAIAPAEKTLTINETKTQNNFSVTVEKVEIAKEETRIYLSVKNSSQDKVSFYTYDSKIVQGDKQIEIKNIFENEEELPNEFLPNVEMEGVIIFSPIDYTKKSLILYLDTPYSRDFRLDFEEFIFDINLFN